MIAQKKNARRALEQLTRKLAGMIRARKYVTAAQPMTLGLPVRDTGRPHGSRTSDGRVQMQRIGPPRLMVKVLHGRTVRVVLRDRSVPMNRAMPKGVTGAALFSYVGEHPPAAQELEKWTFERNTSKTVATVRPGKAGEPLPPGTRVWIIAFWENRRCVRGPICEPVYAHTQYGIEIGSLQKLRKAA